MSGKIQLLAAILLAGVVSCTGSGRDFVMHRGDALVIELPADAAPVLSTAAEIVRSDFSTVLDTRPEGSPKIVKVSYAAADSPLAGQHEAFCIRVAGPDTIEITGSDDHGAAYGLLELSRLIGVSPWEWWADCTPDKRDRFTLKSRYESTQAPSVAYRGIFINDEDFALVPWVWKYFGEAPGRIGPDANARIFELLLRLRANSYWPAMHGCSEPFFLVEGNREVAEKYGIYVGSSHCEPMASNANGEWRVRGKGEYNFIDNRQAVLDFWRERVESVASQEVIYTLGMRGIHDGPMAGARTPEEQKQALEAVIAAQREMLAEYVNEDLTKIPQVFIPYKEVLLAYNEGLEIPEDVMLMWCDDNYGYIRHFPTEEEQSRPGGNGLYYHVSYWGRPHDYLWLGTFSPSLLYQQMNLAFDKGIRKMWILNVGDIKPEEYQIELFMDMAWDMDGVRSEGVFRHMEAFLAREFGRKAAKKLLPVLQEHYRLAYIRKPEFMGNTREEERNPVYKIVKDLPWDRETIDERLGAYAQLYDAVETLANDIPEEKQTAYYHLVQYPVQAAARMNEKTLKAQLARHGLADWSESDRAFEDIIRLTGRYNTGKWEGMMNAAPRGLPVFEPLPHNSVSEPLHEARRLLAGWNAMDCASGVPVPCEGLGYQGGAAMIPKGESLSFRFRATDTSAIVSVRMLPSHPVSSPQLRFAIAVDGQTMGEFAYETYDRSEEWKENVLGNQAVREIPVVLDGKSKRHTVSITALDEGEVLDQLFVFAD